VNAPEEVTSGGQGEEAGEFGGLASYFSSQVDETE
jgi:hypothetical protein